MTHAADPYLRRLVPFELEPLMETYLGGDVPPEVWGPRLWALLHALAHYEPRHVARVLRVLTSLIPCRACGDYLRRWLLSHPGPFAEDAAAPTTRNKSDAEEEEASRVAQAYVVALHNHVNKKLGKNVEMVFYSYL
jgi:Na+-transporting methylmalonyl-CoA/oxaloacetate decarboxylase gamma subunit